MEGGGSGEIVEARRDYGQDLSGATRHSSRGPDGGTTLKKRLHAYLKSAW